VENRPEEENPPPVDILADETGEGSDHYARLPDRLTRYAVARHRAAAMAQYIAGLGEPDSDRAKVLRELDSCGTYLVFRHYLESDRVRLHGMRSCRQHIICPLCAIRRGARMLARYMERVELVLSENPNLKAYMVTLTIKNGVDLAERFAHLQKSVQALNKTRTGSRQSSELSKAAGGMYSYEFKRGENSGEWHPHVHAVWLCEEEPNQQALSLDWKRITGDSYIVEVHALYGELVDAFCEVFKYAVKFGGLPLADNWEAFGSLRRHQLIGSIGNLRGVVIPADLTDDLLDEPKWIDLLYRYIDHGGSEFGYALERETPSVTKFDTLDHETYSAEYDAAVRSENRPAPPWAARFAPDFLPTKQPKGIEDTGAHVAVLRDS